MSNLVPSVSLSSLYGLVSSPLKGSSTAPPSPSPTFVSSRSSGSNTSTSTVVDSSIDAFHPNQIVTSRATGAAYLHPAHAPPSYHANVPEAQLQLSTECPSCAHPVVLKVPGALLAAANVNNQRLEMDRYGQDGRWIEGDYRRGGQVTERDRRDQWRAGVVGGAVHVAKAFKESRFPEMLLNLFRLIISFILWLDARFELHQRILVVVWAVLEDLVKIEREVGILRHSGEAISVFWEAAVKGTIALAKSDDAPAAPAPPPSPMHYPASHYGPGSAMFPFPTFDQSQSNSYPPSPPSRGGMHRTRAASPSAYAQPSFAYTSEDDISTVDMSSSDPDTTPRKAASGLRQRRTLRRTAYSTPSLKEQMATQEPGTPNGARSGRSTPGTGGSSYLGAEAYFDGPSSMRPNMIRRRSRSGPEEKPRREARGWAEMVAGAVAGRIRPSS